VENGAIPNRLVLFVAIKGLRFMLQMYDTWCWFWAWVHGICVNSSIVDKEALVKTSPYKLRANASQLDTTRPNPN
jgi:hypothetical protein